MGTCRRKTPATRRSVACLCPPLGLRNRRFQPMKHRRESRSLRNDKRSGDSDSITSTQFAINPTTARWCAFAASSPVSSVMYQKAPAYADAEKTRNEFAVARGGPLFTTSELPSWTEIIKPRIWRVVEVMDLEYRRNFPKNRQKVRAGLLYSWRQQIQTTQMTH